MAIERTLRVQCSKARFGQAKDRETKMNTKPPIRIELTPEQKEELRKVEGKESPVIRLSLEQLEQRLTAALFLR
jgi:hypothetical protein